MYTNLFTHSNFTLKKCNINQALSIWKNSTGIPVAEFDDRPAIIDWIKRNKWEDVRDFLRTLRLLGLIGEISDE